MSTSDLSAGDVDVTLLRLTGHGNYNQWVRDFRVVAELKGVWKFYTGEEKILSKPDQDSYLKPKAERKIANAPTIASATTSREASYGADADAYILQARIAEFPFELDEYGDNEVKLRLAKSLLAFWVDPAIRIRLQTHSTPAVAWNWLKQQYNMTNAKAIDSALGRIERLKLPDCKSMQDYINQHILLKFDIVEARGNCDDYLMAFNILRGLGFRYNTFINQYYILENAKDTANASSKNIASRLLAFEFKLEERAEQKRAEKDTSSKGNKVTAAGKYWKKSYTKYTYEPCAKWGHSVDECRLKKAHSSGK